MYNERLLAAAILKQAKDDYIDMRRNRTKAMKYLRMIKNGEPVPEGVTTQICLNRIADYDQQKLFWLTDAHIWMEYLDCDLPQDEIIEMLNSWDAIARNHHYPREGTWVYI